MAMLRIAEVLTTATLLVAVGARRMIRTSEQALQSKGTTGIPFEPEAPTRVLSLPKAALQKHQDGAHEWAEFQGCKYSLGTAGDSFAVNVPSTDSDENRTYGMKMAVSAGADLMVVSGTHLSGGAYTFINLHRDGNEVIVNPQAVECFEEYKTDRLFVRRSAKLTTPTCPVSDTDKSDCGFHGVSESECEDKGCCWAESHTGRNVPWCFHKSKSGTDPAYVWLNSEGRTALLAQVTMLLSDCRASLTSAMEQVIKQFAFEGRERDLDRESWNQMVTEIVLFPLSFIGLEGAAAKLVNNPKVKKSFTEGTSKVSNAVYEKFQKFAASENAQTELVDKVTEFAQEKAKDAFKTSDETVFVKEVSRWAAKIQEKYQGFHANIVQEFRAWSNQEILFTVAEGKWVKELGDESTCSVAYQKVYFEKMMKTVVGILKFGTNCGGTNYIHCLSGTWHEAWCYGGSTGGQFADIWTNRYCPSSPSGANSECRDDCQVTLKEEIPYFKTFDADLRKGMGRFAGCPSHCLLKGR